MPRDTKELTDEELMRSVMEKDGEAYSEIVRRHTDRYYALSYRMLSEREGAEDIVQDSFLMLWNSPDKWDESKNAKFTTWFYRVVVNACLDQRKKARFDTSDEDFELASQAQAQDEASELKRTKDKVGALIQELPGSQQTALTLCFYEGLSNKEAASVMDLSVKALESLLMRAKSTLRQKLMVKRKTEVL
jgi:RNA polymerase sigma-70 factor, ECF subfamily